MAFTQAVPQEPRLNADGSVSIVLVYSGIGEEATKETITLPAGSVLDQITLRKEAIRRVSNRNAGAEFKQFVEQIKDQPLDLSPIDDSEDDETLKAFSVLRGRELDLKASSEAGDASTEAYEAARAARQAAYAQAKPELQEKMDTFHRGAF